MTAESIDVLVVGAGVIGLAIGRALASRGYEVVVVERHLAPGQETSSRNSGVIHSGIYYPTGSLKARLCVSGREQLYAYCEARGINHRRCGKLIVAQDSQLDELQKLRHKALENGVTDLRWLSASEVAELEPDVRCSAALLSPSTGIVDVHEYMLALQGDLEASNGTIVFDSEVVGARQCDAHLAATIRSGESSQEFLCRHLINSAGLRAVDLLRQIEGYPTARLRTAYYAKGNYFVCQGARPFNHLVYPMPNEAGLGVHATLSLDGTTRFGPDVEWTTDLNYSVDAKRGESFYDAIREYWPGLPDLSLHPDYAGIRPKLVGAEHKAADFEIEGPSDHGIGGLVNLLGIESPGLTSSLAIAEHVYRIVAAASDSPATEPLT